MDLRRAAARVVARDAARSAACVGVTAVAATMTSRAAVRVNVRELLRAIRSPKSLATPGAPLIAY